MFFLLQLERDQIWPFDLHVVFGGDKHSHRNSALMAKTWQCSWLMYWLWNLFIPKFGWVLASRVGPSVPYAPHNVGLQVPSLGFNAQSSNQSGLILKPLWNRYKPAHFTVPFRRWQPVPAFYKYSCREHWVKIRFRVYLSVFPKA